MAINVDQQQSDNNLFFIRNILDTFDSYTYNLTLSLYYGDLATETRIPNLNDKHVILAKSGETAQFVIQRTEIFNIPGTSVASKGATTTKITMDIVEPLGFTLIDRMIGAGLYLGLKTLSQVPYVLAVNFIGWDKDGNNVSSIIDTKYYIMNLLDVKPSLSSSATNYSLTFSVLNELVQQQSLSEMPRNIKFKKENLLINTLENFAKALTDASNISSESDVSINTIAGDRNAPNRLKHIYKFSVQDGSDGISKLSSWTMLSNESQNSNKQFSVSSLTESSINQEMVAKEGKAIFHVLNGILAHTNEAYKFVCPAATPNKADFDSEKEFNKWFHYDTETTYGALDPVSGSYSQIHTITIVPKVVSRLAVLSNDPGKDDAVKQLISQGLLLKRYEYIFTGLNTSILSLNLDLNTFWKDSILIFTSALANNGLSTTLNPSYSTNSTWNPTVVAVNKSTYDGKDTSSFVSSANKQDDTTDTKYTYLEDFPATAVSLESFARQEPDRDYSRSKLLTQGFSSPGGIISNSKISIFSYMCDSAFVSTRSTLGAPTAMLKINMVIRGDPYWLGTSTEEQKSLYNNNTYEHIRLNQSRYAVFQSGENNLFLRFRPAQGIDDSGLMSVSDASVFNACYSVLQVRSIFERGEFTQELEAVINRSFYTPSVQEVCNDLQEKDPTSPNKDSTEKNINVQSSTTSNEGSRGERVLSPSEQSTGIIIEGSAP